MGWEGEASVVIDYGIHLILFGQEMLHVRTHCMAKVGYG